MLLLKQFLINWIPHPEDQYNLPTKFIGAIIKQFVPM